MTAAGTRGLWSGIVAAAAFVAVALLAAALRLPDLAARPMHADEAVHADKFATLLEGGGYAYDPVDYHGPTLYYATLLAARAQGASRYVEIDERTLRLVPAAFGVALVALHVLARGALGTPAALLAALLAAVSPAMVYYSRYYIHETLLVFFTFGLLIAAFRYLVRPGPGAAVLAGACAGLMLATKETAPLALGSLLVALGLSELAERRRAAGGRAIRRLVAKRHVLWATLAAIVVSALLFSSFFAHPRGMVDAVRAYGILLERAGGSTWHVHPWTYYLGLLVHFPSRGTPFWTEAPIVALAIVGAAGAWRDSVAREGEARLVRLLSLYALLLLVLYSAIPYKTPWCLLGFLHGMILLAGAGAVALARAGRRFAPRAFVSLLLVALAAHLGWQAYAASFRFAADPRNPYVYAHTGRDVFEIAERVTELARAHEDGTAMPVQIVSRQNLWPLPFYLRRLTGLSWWTGVSEEAPNAPVILATPEMEPALARKLYDLPPPGERELYVRIFDRPLELRPGVELRGYAASGLWNELHERAVSRPVTR